MNLTDELYTNTSFELKSNVLDEANQLRSEVEVSYSSSNPKVLDINTIGIGKKVKSYDLFTLF